MGLSDGLWCGVGPETQVVHWLYVSIIRPSNTFACLVWWPSCQTASTEKRLSRVQRLACVGITGARRTTPTGAMEAFPGLLPLDPVSGVWDVGPTFNPVEDSSLLMRLQRSDPVFNMGVHVIRPAFYLELKYRVTMLTREEWTRGPGLLL